MRGEVPHINKNIRQPCKSNGCGKTNSSEKGKNNGM